MISKSNRNSQEAPSISWNKSDFQIPSVSFLPEFSIHEPVLKNQQRQNSKQIKPFKNNNLFTHGKDNSMSKYLNFRQRNDSYNSLFGNDETMLNLSNGILSEGEFNTILEDKTDSVEKFRHKKAAQKFYKTKKQENMNWGLYYAKYIEWKNKPDQQNHTYPAIDISNHMRDQPSLTDIILEKQLRQGQWNSLRKQEKTKIMQKRMRNMKRQMQSISLEFQNKMSQLLEKSKYAYQNPNQQKKELKDPKLSIEKIQYPSLFISKQKQQKQIRKNKQEKLIDHASYVDLIKNPPRKYQYQHKKKSYKKAEQDILDDYQVSIISALQKTQKNENQKTKYLWKLNISEILKMPHRHFIIFYAQNQGRIHALSTPDQLKAINRYRSEALQRQQALRKLKEKISKQGTNVLNKLSKQKKQQLFQLLYQDQLEGEVLRIQKQTEQIS